MGVVDHPAQAKIMRNAVTKGTLSHAWELGKVYREALEKRIPTAEHVVHCCCGFQLFDGVVRDFHYETVEGFTVGETEILLHGLPHPSPNLATNQGWYTNVLKMLTNFYDYRINPDHYLLASWIQVPNQAVSGSDPYTLTNTASDILEHALLP